MVVRVQALTVVAVGLFSGALTLQSTGVTGIPELLLGISFD
jgi:hypothetical protein